MFIDQNARDIREELSVLPSLLGTADMHIVLGSRPMTRAWCCYEIALFNRSLAIGADPVEFRSFVAPTKEIYPGWERVEVTDAGDKTAIGEEIAERFPGGMPRFRHIMDQASASAVLSAVNPNPSYPPAALQSLRASAGSWFARDSSSWS